MNVSYPNLDEFLGTYFHQDWREDEPTADRIVNKYLSEWPRDDALLALRELENLLSENYGDAKLRELLDEMGCYYDPLGDAMTCASWLSGIREKMTTQLLE
ncbi:contact-dependent growth inhibition system immunity protein [Paraburkholderia sp. J10-1]|uniref:contact-dependent growth inhibition system immunity protein n=1 Tax=Paraburkholderia sp. J10-1 TaxID=2805430 RepID=UPI002AB7082A|nr:contact-dependent growth inhibition system immunity protein [Paraburkholderia sp. J10-1]